MLVRYMRSLRVHLSVSPSVTSRSYSRMTKPRSHKQHHVIAQGLFSDAKTRGEIPTGSPPTMAPNRGRVGSNWRF